jgi:hypothetical protein
VRQIVIIAVALLVFGCSNGPTEGYTTVMVQEVEQVGSYTYMLVRSDGSEHWIAAQSMTAFPGETYKYRGGLLMEDFYSKDLDKTFDQVLFLDKIISENASVNSGSAPMDETHASMHQDTQELTPGSVVVNEKSDVNIASAEGMVSIADLFSNPASYNGKTIRVQAEVTKVNNAIMERNWVHLQDGTEHDGRYDLTATSSEQFEVGTTVIVEGVITLDKDFGYGYNYEILMEKTTAVK